jgi:hypothetical protein
MVSMLSCALSTSEHLLVSFATQLPPAVSPSACCWRTQRACELTPIWPPMSDAGHNQSMKQQMA